MPMIAHFAPHPDKPHGVIRRLALDFEHMSWAERRIVLQALPLPDLTQLARVLVEHRPAKWRTPDLAWGWLRIIMDPMSWDIKLELRDDVPHYVSYWASKELFARAAPLDCRAAVFQALDKDMQAFFDACYPQHLIDVCTEVIYAA